jgi:hypothetical protein
MKRFSAAFPLFVLALALASSAAAQVKEMTGDIAGDPVEAIDHTAGPRRLGRGRRVVTIDISPAVRGFRDQVGDKTRHATTTTSRFG